MSNSPTNLDSDSVPVYFLFFLLLYRTNINVEWIHSFSVLQSSQKLRFMTIGVKINVVRVVIAFYAATFFLFSVQTACCFSQCQLTARGIGQAGGANRDDKHCRKLHLFSLHTPSFSSAEKETFTCIFTQSGGRGGDSTLKPICPLGLS